MRLIQHFKSERGMALPMALGMVMVLTISIGAAIALTTSGQRNANRSKASDTAYNLGEAGLAEAFSVLEQAADPTAITMPATTRTLEGGTVTFSGTYAAPTWTITSIGSARNPTGGADVTRKLTQTATVQPLVAGATAPEWDRLFHANTSTCMTIDTVTITASVTSAGDLCLEGTGNIAGSNSKVEVGDDVTIEGVPGPLQSPDNDPDAGSGSSWTNPGYIVSSNTQRASYNVPQNSQSTNLQATDYDFALPSNATILGIEVRIEHHASGGSVDDQDVYLLKGGSPAGSNKASSTDWPQPSSNDEAYATYGGSSDLWGTTWTPSDVNATNFGVRLRVDNDAGSTRTAFVNHIQVEVYYRTETINGSIGTSGTPVSRAEVVGTCKAGSQAANSPCSAADRVWASTVTTTPPNLQKPQVDMLYWYNNAKPGPKHPCNNPGGDFPGGFDNNAAMDGSLPDYGNDNENLDQLTPSNTSYSCQVIENGNVVGELTWNHTTHVLKIKGTSFIDGNVRFDKDGSLINYQGRAIIYAGGDLEFDEVVCAGGDGTFNCFNDMSNWDPEQNLMIILSAGWSEYDQGDNLEPAAFQGVMYAQDQCLIHQAFRSSGPILCDEIQIPYNGAWPTFYPWPPLQTLIAGQMYGSFATASDYTLILGNQVG